MTAFAAYLLPLPDLYQHPMAGAITGNPLLQPTTLTLVDPLHTPMLFGTLNHIGVTPRVTFNHSAYVLPGFDEDLFNHFLIVPSKLALGNLLSDQAKTVEIANMYFTDKAVDAVINHAGSGIAFPGLPSLPQTLHPFSSLIVNVSISAAGQPSILGTIEIDAGDVGGGNVQDLFIPVTGQRITLWLWSPEQFYTEELQWATDVIESYDGTEQRIKIRQNPRQVLTYQNFQTDSVQDMQMRLALFNWMAQVWGVPIWWEQAPTTSAMAPGAVSIPVNTANADYRNSSLVFIRNPQGQSEAFQINSITSTALGITSGVINSYPKGSQVMPIRTAYAKTQTQQQVYLTGAEKLTIQFTTLDNVSLANIAGSFTLYQSKVVLDDINYVDGMLTEGMSRNGVTVIDNTSGVIYQQFSTDRSRPSTTKTWWTDTKDQIWPIRQFLHAVGGSQGTFWLPTNRNDLKLIASITGGSATFSIAYVGYSLFGLDATGVPMRPFADVRFTLTDGTKILRQITGAVNGGATETITVDSLISATTLTTAQVARIEFLQLVRIADDKALLTHDHPGRSQIVINLVGVKS
jgi:hypothetical protein